MSENFSKLGFAKTYIYPALALFLIPIGCLVFYSYVQSTYDQQFLEAARADIHNDRQLTPEEKGGLIAFYETFPPSRLIVSNQPGAAEWRELQDTQYLIEQYSLAWGVRISWLCIGEYLVQI